ncbi:hypothetical protein OUZ56_029059 [Daphnia magna]|uniref:Uncharacterized protein n=1 Tax=Daphnia magna TaxID=35525 RepID=A0ABR0B5P2_9CRUS|nr:hypothetical protein OUZ56_029059 [Daphnia magna]
MTHTECNFSFNNQRCHLREERKKKQASNTSIDFVIRFLTGLLILLVLDYRKIMLPLGYKELIAAFFKNLFKNQQRASSLYPELAKFLSTVATKRVFGTDSIQPNFSGRDCRTLYAMCTAAICTTTIAFSYYQPQIPSSSTQTNYTINKYS